MKSTLWATLLATTLLSGCSGKSLELNAPPANATVNEAESMSWISRAAMDAYLRSQVWTGARSGFVTIFAKNGQPVYANAVGWADIEAKEPMRLDTPMRFASMTKPVTAVAAMKLVEQGKLGLDDRVAKYIPAFEDVQVASKHSRNAEGNFDTSKPNTPLLIRHLLMFASGVGPGMENNPSELYEHWEENSPYYQGPEPLAERINKIARLPLFEHPGTAWRYGWSADVLARVVEVAAGQAFDEYLVQTIFTPLGMQATRHFASDPQRAGLATVYTKDDAGDLVTSPTSHDTTNWTPGGSGIVSTACDFLRFALMLWNGGEYQGVRILQAETVAEMTRLHLKSGVLAEQDLEGLGWGLGMAVVADADSSIMSDHNGDFWWGGYYGTTFFVSPETGVVGVLLSQNEPVGLTGEGGPTSLYVAKAIAEAGLGD